jgi:hypothetical protein
MTSVFWFSTEYFWIWVLALLIVCAGSIFRIYRHKRLRKFCNPALSGTIARWYQLGVMIILLALGISSTAAIIPALTKKAPQSEIVPPPIALLLDSDSASKAAVTPKDSLYWLQDSIRWILENAPQEKISVWQTGTPVKLLIPATWDMQAIQMLVPAAFETQKESNANGVPDAVSRMFLAPRQSVGRIVVVSAQIDSAIEKLARSTPNAGNVVFFMHRSIDPISAPKYYYQNKAGNWVWESAASGFRELLQSNVQRKKGINSWLARMSLVQKLALLAFVLLSMETVCQLLIFRN